MNRLQLVLTETDTGTSILYFENPKTNKTGKIINLIGIDYY